MKNKKTKGMFATINRNEGLICLFDANSNTHSFTCLSEKTGEWHNAYAYPERTFYAEKLDLSEEELTKTRAEMLANVKDEMI